jgi:hypothetical protein
MKTSKYMTRALRSQDRRYAVVLGKLGHSSAFVQPSVQPALKPDVDPLTALRAEYQQVVGKRAFHGWSADELKAKIAEAKETR